MMGNGTCAPANVFATGHCTVRKLSNHTGMAYFLAAVLVCPDGLRHLNMSIHNKPGGSLWIVKMHAVSRRDILGAAPSWRFVWCALCNYRLNKWKRPHMRQPFQPAFVLLRPAAHTGTGCHAATAFLSRQKGFCPK